MIVNEPWFFLSHRLAVAQAAQKQGYTVHVATRPGKTVAKINSLGFIHHELALSRSGNSVLSELGSFFAIWKLLFTLKPDVVHLVTIKPVLYGGIAARFTSVKKVVAAVSGLGTLFLAQGAKAEIKRKIGAGLYRFALRSKKVTVIFQNPDDQHMLMDFGAVKPEQAVMIRGSGVDLNTCPFVPENLSDTPVLTFAARLLFDKGIQEFVDAAQILKQRGVDATFQIVGDIDPGNLTSVTNEQLKQWAKLGHIEVLGFSEDIGSVFAASNLVVLPSYREGLPKVLIEAAACGRAVVTTDVPGCRDAITENVTGLLVPVKNADALADAIEKLILNPDLRQQMGQAGRQLAEQEFTIDKVIQQHLDIYQGLI